MLRGVALSNVMTSTARNYSPNNNDRVSESPKGSSGVTPRVATKTAERLFGQEITRVRRNRGISQEELGFQAAVHRTYVSQIERGLKSPTLAVILRLTQA